MSRYQSSRTIRTAGVIGLPLPSWKDSRNLRAASDHSVISLTRLSDADTIAMPSSPRVSSLRERSLLPTQRFGSTKASCHSGLFDTLLLPIETPDCERSGRSFRSPARDSSSRSPRKRIHDLDPRRLEILPVASDQHQSVGKCGRRDQAVLDRHRSSAGAESSKKLPPAEAGIGIHRHAMDPAHHLGEPEFQRVSAPSWPQ